MASDHRGFALKQALRERLEAAGYDGQSTSAPHGAESVDYPEFAAPAARAVSRRRSGARHRDLRQRASA